MLWSGCFVSADRVLTVGGNAARLWDTTKRETLMSFMPHGAVATVDFSPNGEQLLTGSWDTTAKLWDVATARPLRKLPLEHRGPINAALFSPNGEELLTVSDDGTAIIWDAAKLTVKQQVGLGGERLRAGVWLPNGTQVAVAGNDTIARIFDTATARWSMNSPATTPRSPASPSRVMAAGSRPAAKITRSASGTRRLAPRGANLRVTRPV